MQIITSAATLTELTIPQDATRDQWATIHRQVVICKRASARWIKQSREFAAAKWGVDFVAETEVQIELALGLPVAEEKQSINPGDKSARIVTIEGISQSFSMWSRKVDADLPTWDKDQLTRALALVEPIERKAVEIRRMLS